MTFTAPQQQTEESAYAHLSEWLQQHFFSKSDHNENTHDND